MLPANAAVAGAGDALRRGRARVRRAAAHPFREVGDLLVAELLILRRHLQVFILVADGLDQERIIGLARHEGRTGVAAVQNGLA